MKKKANTNRSWIMRYDYQPLTAEAAKKLTEHLDKFRRAGLGKAYGFRWTPNG